MNENLLQYLWNYRIFSSFDFRDVEGNEIEILDFGKWNRNSGPDFLDAKIKTGNVILAGNIELHVRSSDWIFHNHSNDKAFDNVILHAVYQHDSDLEEFKSRAIPTLQLYDYINHSVLKKYGSLVSHYGFIPCEQIFDPKKVPFDFVNETLLKKLDEKSVEIENRLQKQRNDAEAVLFQQLAYAFGLKVNGEIFRNIAENIDFSVIRKISQNQLQLEALFFGSAGWLENPADEQTRIWKREYDFLKLKYKLNENIFRPKFLRLRPPNFPTIRLSQLAHLYHREQNLFSKIISARNTSQLADIFSGIKASGYWNRHFNFQKETETAHEKTLTKDFVELILINAVLPLKYTFGKYNCENTADEISDFYQKIPAEKNTVTQNWKKLGVEMLSSAESQAFIWHYKYSCEPKNCLNCSIGLKLLKDPS